MCASHVRFWASAVVLFFLVMTGTLDGFRDEGERNGGKDAKIVAFKLIGITAVPKTEFMIVYHSPYKWRCEESLIDLFKKVSICDGEVAWSYSIEKSRIKDIKKWNAEKAVKKYGPELAYDRLMIGDNRIIVYALANPYHQRWKKEFSFPLYDFYIMKKRKEEMLGRTSCVVYETGEDLKIIMWFGVDDGLLRKEIISDQGSKVEEIVVEEVKINPKLDDDLFRFTPPPRAMVVDRTENLFRDIEKQIDLYKKLPKKEKEGKKLKK